MIKGAIVASFFAMSTSFFYSTPAHAYQCKPSYRIGVGNARGKFMAKARARSKWTSSTKGAYGLAWSVWKIASPKSINCSKQGTKWRCAAYAKPCLYVVG